MKINFSNPPINEVVVGKVVEAVPLLVPHYGIFWGLLRADYPNCQHAPPILDSTPPSGVEFVPEVPLPRVFFLSGDGSRLVQLQSDRFYANWRKISDEDSYVRFESIRDVYSGLEPRYRSFLRDELSVDLKVKRYDVTYSNFIPLSSEPSGSFELRDIFRGMEWAALAGEKTPSTPNAYHLRLEFPMRNAEGRLFVTIQSVRRKVADGVQEAIKLDIAAQGKPNGQDFDSELVWLDKANADIVDTFCQITTDDAQKRLWGRQ